MRDHNAENDEKDDPHHNLRFLIKWQNYSHIHNTWETYDYLKRFKGFKRVDNYIKGPWTLRQKVINDPSTSREDFEAIEIDKERLAEQLEGYKQVERIVAERNAPANADIDHEHRRSSVEVVQSAIDHISSPQSSICANGAD